MGKIVSEHIVDIFKIANRYRPKGHDVREYWGDVFIKCLESEPRFNKNRKKTFGNFVFPAIKGCMIDSRMAEVDRKQLAVKKIREYRTIFVDTENFDPVEYKTPHSKYIEKELESIFFQFVGSLPYQQRIFIWLYFYKDLEFKEISEKIGVTVGRLSQIKKQALSKLRFKILNKTDWYR